MNLQNTFETAVALTDHTTNYTDIESLDQQVKSMMMFSDNADPYGHRGRARICKVCGKEGSWQIIMNHIEAHHITGMVHTCGICGKGSRSRDGLRRHNIREHF